MVYGLRYRPLLEVEIANLAVPWGHRYKQIDGPIDEKLPTLFFESKPEISMLQREIWLLGHRRMSSFRQASCTPSNERKEKRARSI
jgi:hypothetical protein